MHLVWLEVRDFRSHPAVEFRPDPGVNVLVGANGSGKTSLLEAIGYLATLTSFRRSPDSALVRAGADAAITRGEFSSGPSEALVEIETPAAGRRRVLLNGKGGRSRADIAEVVAMVAFLPDDLDLVKRGPSYRREFLDDLAAQTWPVAGSEQADYDRAIRQRNALLRREGRHADVATLDVLDERVGRLGAIVLARRLAAVALVAPEVSGLYADLGETPEAIGWRYASAGLGPLEGEPAAAELAGPLLEAIAAARRADLDRRTTTVGPHRDDVVITLGGREARTMASQGEQRSITLGMRLAAAAILTERRGTTPVVLLDDVFSELDAARGHRLVARFPEGQVFVTTARAEEVPMVGRRWSVAEGSVVEA
jgi:DNA replication and repair protein RecF